MCCYAYRLSAFKGQVCPYGTEPFATVPVDQKGYCVFHSSEASFKQRYFQDALGALLINGIGSSLNFREFKFNLNQKAWRSILPNTLGTFDARGASFEQGFYLKNATLGLLVLDDADFLRPVSIENVRCVNIYANRSTFRGLTLDRLTVSQSAVFQRSEFHQFVVIANAHFEGLTSFRNSNFRGSQPGQKLNLSESQFQEIDFTEADFGMDVLIEDGEFAGTVSFTDTRFRVGTDLDIYHPKIRGDWQFRASDDREKLFPNQVAFLVRPEEVQGMIRFENARLVNIISSHLETLQSLVPSGRVSIGRGCLKYRLQTPLRRVALAPHNQPLLRELTNAFANFFQYDQELNLGVEIEKTTSTYVEYFFYSDADLTEPEFFERLSRGEQHLWDVVTIDRDTMIVHADGTTSEQTIGRYDALISLGSLFLKITARALQGQITLEEIEQLRKGTYRKGLPVEKLNHKRNVMINVLSFNNRQTIKSNNP